MRLLSVNTGKAVPFDNKTGKTAIDKQPRTGPVAIGEFGLGGDEIADLENHGGHDQAVYLYGQTDYEFWEAELGRNLPPGQFGENLTIEGLDSREILIGDRFEIGPVMLEATSPRIPCATFAARMGDPKWVKRFHAAGRPGVYVRVLRTGAVEAGMEVLHHRFEGEPIPITEMMQDTRSPSPERMRWFLKTPIHEESRQAYEEKLGL